jgi:tryptophan synthase alpha chain
LKLIRLIAPTSDYARLPVLCKSASGFVYYVSVAGVTGEKSADMGALQKQISHLRGFTKLPVAVGFGIRTPEQAAQVAKFSDAVVVGSALVDVLAISGEDAAIAFVKELAAAL